MNTYINKIETYLYRTLKATAWATLTLGVLLLTGSLGAVVGNNQVAAVLDGLTTIDSATGISTSTEPVPEVTPVVSSSISFSSSLLSDAKNSFEVEIKFVEITNPRLVVKGLDNDRNILLEPTSLSKDSAIFIVPFEKLVQGKFELVAKGKKTNGLILEAVGPVIEVNPTVTSTNTDVVNLPVKTSVSTTTDPLIRDTSTSSTDILRVVEKPLAEKASTTVLTKLRLALPTQDIYRGFVPLQILTTTKVTSVSLYVKSVAKNEAQFVGAARHYLDNEWMYILNTNNIPDGKYLIYATTELRDSTVESERLGLNVINSILNTSLTRSTSTEPVKAILSTVEKPNPLPVIEVKSTSGGVTEQSPATLLEKTKEVLSIRPDSVVLSGNLKMQVPIVLKEYQGRINLSLKSYSEIVRLSGDISPEAASKTVEEILAYLLVDRRLQSLSAEAEVRLQNEVAGMVSRAGRVEVLLARKIETKQENEEFALELSKIVVIQEDSLVDVSSPREFGLVRGDILKVSSVSPIEVTDSVSSTTKVYTEIRGQALPNSLVTLYIYSTPVMVTVQTDADGTFTYVYEKDLEGGDHEVYVALTTEMGAVAVKSEGFQFVREAEAFNSINTSNGDILVPIVDRSSLLSNPYFIVLSISLLLVGLAMLFIGIQLGRKSEDVEIIS